MKLGQIFDIKHSGGGSARPSESGQQTRDSSLCKYHWCSQYVRGLSVLDVGSGHGYGASYLASTAKQVIGIDIDDKAIRFAQGHYSQPNLRFLLFDIAETNDTQAKFVSDALVSFEVIEHVQNTEGFLRFLLMNSRRGASVFLSTPNKLFTQQFYKHGKPLNPWHVHEFYPMELSQLLNTYFDIAGCYSLVGKWDDSSIKHLQYLSHCAVPVWIRSLIPKALKDQWVKLRLGQTPHQELDCDKFEMVSFKSPQEITSKFPDQTYWLKTKD
jgi:SAM-dependent methyltransferase